MKSFIFFCVGVGCTIALGALFYSFQAISFTWPHEHEAIQAHRQQKDSTIFVVGQRDMKWISEFHQQNGVCIKDLSTKEMNRHTKMEVMNVIAGLPNFLHSANVEELEPHIQEWIDKEKEATIRGNKIYKRVRAVTINPTLMTKSRFEITLFDEIFTVIVKHAEHRRSINDEMVWSLTGSLENQPESSVTMVCSIDILNGSIRTINNSYSIIPCPPSKEGAEWNKRYRSTHLLVDIDQKAFAGEH